MEVAGRGLIIEVVGHFALCFFAAFARRRALFLSIFNPQCRNEAIVTAEEPGKTGMVMPMVLVPVVMLRVRPRG